MKKHTEVCIVGAGPGGAMLALLLARQGVQVILIERALTCEREFRGETISPDGVAILTEVGVMPDIEAHGYIQTKKWQLYENQQKCLDIDFGRFDYPFKYSIDVPQPVLINALLNAAKKYAHFTHLAGARVEQLLEQAGAVQGVVCQLSDGSSLEIHSAVVVGADGRYGKLRKMAGLAAKVRPLTRDVLWFMLPRPSHWGERVKLSILKNQHVVGLPTYPDLLRVGFNIPAGQFKQVREQPIQFLHDRVAELDPSLAQSVKEQIKSWSDTHFLDVFTADVPRWAKKGFVLLGDAAHTLSPVLGQGVNHALKDALDLADVIAEGLAQYPHTILPESVFTPYVKRRKPEVDFVHHFQIRQEHLLSFASPFKTYLRRLVYRVMNASHFLQSLLWERILYHHQREQKIQARSKA